VELDQIEERNLRGINWKEVPRIREILPPETWKGSFAPPKIPGKNYRTIVKWKQVILNGSVTPFYPNGLENTTLP